MATGEQDVGGGAQMESDTQGGGTTGFNAGVGDTGDVGGTTPPFNTDVGPVGDVGGAAGGGAGEEVGLGVSGAQTGSSGGDMDSGGGVATDFPKAEALGAKQEGDDPGAKTDFLPPPTIAEFDEQAKGQES